MQTAAVVCQQCDGAIPPNDVNVGEGVAYCRACGVVTRLSDLLGFDRDGDLDGADAANPPSGCVIRDDGAWTRITASGRSVGSGCGLLFFALFWNGIVSVFVLIALASTLHHIFGSVPAWFPAPPMGSSGSGGGWNSGSGALMPVGMTIFMWIFLTPFITVGVIVVGSFLTTLFGRVEVRLRGNEGLAFTGVGPVGWKRRFDASDVKRVSVESKRGKNDDTSESIVIKLGGGKKVKLGSILTDERRAWMAAVLRELLVVE